MIFPSLPVIAIAAAVAVSGAYVAGRIHGGDRVREAWDASKAQQLQAQVEAEQAARRVEAERLKLSQEIADDAQRKVAAARRDAAAAARVADGLRDAARAAAASCAARDPAAPGRSPADELADVLADMEQEGRSLAASADAAVIAGHACERAYLSLHSKEKP